MASVLNKVFSANYGCNNRVVSRVNMCMFGLPGWLGQEGEASKSMDYTFFLLGDFLDRWVKLTLWGSSIWTLSSVVAVFKAVDLCFLVRSVPLPIIIAKSPPNPNK